MAASMIGLLCLLNPVVFRVVSLLGERETYYRLLWIVPILLGSGYLCVKVFTAAKTKYQKNLVLGILAVFLAVTGSATWIDFFRVPSNIYQMDDDVIQIADAIEELSPGKRVGFLSNGDIDDLIRQYNANICLFMNGTHEINLMIVNEWIDYGGAYVRQRMAFLKPEYIAIKKESIKVVHLLKSSGIDIVFESDNYYLFEVKSDEIEADNAYLAGFTKEKITALNVEYMDLPQSDGEYEFLYAVNLFSSFDEQRIEEVITIAKELEVDAMIVNDEMPSAQLSQEECIRYLEESGIPFVYNQSEEHILEYHDMAIYTASNAEGILGETEQEFIRERLEGEKSLLLITDELVNTASKQSISSGILDLTAEEKQVIVNYARADKWQKAILDKGVYGFTQNTADSHIITLIRVNGNGE